MFKQKFNTVMFLGVLAISLLASCKKEELLGTNENTGADNKPVIFIRAVNKDSSVVQSQQLLLR